MKIILKKNDKKSEKIAGVWTPSCGGHHRRQGKPEDHLPEQLVRHQRQRQGRLDQFFSTFLSSSPGVRQFLYYCPDEKICVKLLSQCFNYICKPQNTKEM